MGGKRKKTSRNGGGRKNSGEQAAKKKHTNGGSGGPSEVILVKSSKKGKAWDQDLPITGLMNLGNTCFFNAVMQNLAQTHFLRQQLGRRMKMESYHMELAVEQQALPNLSLQVVLSADSLDFTKTLANFLDEMNTIGRGVLNPRSVFNHVCKSAPRFRGYQQQDSQELLRYLLEAVKNEEVHCIKRAILQCYNVNSDKKRERISDQDRKDIRLYGAYAGLSRTVVDEVFGGKLLSTVTCLECQNCSRRTEDFLDLSLSIPADKSAKCAVPTAANPNKDGHVTVDHCDARHTSISTNDRVAKDSLLSTEHMSKHQKKKLRKEERKKKKPHKFSLHDLELKASELEQQHASAPAEKSSAKAQETNGDGEKGTNPLQEALLAQSSPQITRVSEKGEEDGGGTDVTEISTLDTQGMPAVVNDALSCSSEEEMDEVEGKKVVEDELCVQSTNIPKPIKQEEDDRLMVGMAEVSIEDTGSNPSASGISQSSSTQESSPLLEMSRQTIQEKTSPSKLASSKPSSLAPEGEGSSEALSSTYSHPQLLDSTPNPFSIEASLYSFCLPEILEGEDRIYCQECAVRLQNSSAVLTKQSPSFEGTCQDSELERTGQAIVARDGVSQGCERCDTCEIGGAVCEGEKCNPSDRGVSSPNDMKRNFGEDTPRKSVNITEARKHSESSNHESESSVRDSEGSLDSSGMEGDNGCSMKDLDDQPEDGKGSCGQNSSSTCQSQTAFCDGIKQMSIDCPPPVLCLHLKRFSQQGKSLRSLKKNSCHIQFPVLLNLAPFCTNHSKDLFDSSGRLLYALYGVVEHGGSMQGGHYVARVRVVADQITNTLPTKQGSSLSDNNSDKPANGVLGCPVDPLEPMSECSNNDMCEKEYDLTACAGQWYYVSDSNVKKSTEADVLNSQAYILFYERVPFASRL